MDLKTKVAKIDELLNTIATHDDEEHSTVIVALAHVKKLADIYLEQTSQRRNEKALLLAESLAQST